MIKTEIISKNVLFACSAAIIVVFGLFFGVGYENPVGDYNEPQFTEVLIYLMYALVAIAALLACWSVIKSIIGSLGFKGENLSGVPGTKISAGSFILMLASLVPGFVIGRGEEDFTAADGTVTSAGMVQMTDVFIFSIYILLVATVLCVAANMLKGVFKK